MFTKESILSKPYTWGEIVNITEVGNYIIVEYKARCDRKYEKESSFHPYVNGKDTNCSWDTLDAAIIHAISFNAGHPGATPFIFNMLR